jgi:hypothetical protein
MYDGTQYQLLAVDRLCLQAITSVSWTDGNKYVTLTFADGTSSQVTIHPTHTAYTGKPTANQTPGFGDTFDLSQVKTNDFGHVTEMTDRTVKIPNDEATKSAAGLMSAADKTNLDTMSGAFVKQYTKTNPALTLDSATGTCVWTIAKADIGNGDPHEAVCSLRDSSGNEVVADVQYTQSNITITINASTDIAASTYTANILIPVIL